MIFHVVLRYSRLYQTGTRIIHLGSPCEIGFKRSKFTSCCKFAEKYASYLIVNTTFDICSTTTSTPFEKYESFSRVTTQ